MAISLHLQVHPWFGKTFHHYVVFTKSIFFILGLIFSYKLVENTFLSILITYLPEYDLRKAVALVSLQQGICAVLVTFFAYAADVYTGHFIMVVSSTALCITGLLLNWVAARNDDLLNLRLFYPALGLMTLAQAALTFTLRAFLDDQVRPTDFTADDGDGDDTAWSRRSSFWWYFMSVIAAIVAQFGPLTGFPLRRMLVVLTVVMGVGLLVFSLGTKYYYFVPRIENPFQDVVTVILGAIVKRKVEYPRTPQELHGNSSGDVYISPRVPWLRWLDRAAIVQEVEASRGGSPSNVEQVREVKFLLKMLAIWSCFLTFSLVVASGSTFFFEEATSLIDEDDGQMPILFFLNLQRLIEFAVSEISSYTIRKLRERQRSSEQKMGHGLVRIGIGMSCCVLCCIAAWATASRRQRESDTMNVYLLTPQFFLLGLMGGLGQEGLESFYKSQVSESRSTYGQPLGEFIMGVGKLLSIFCILIFGRSRFRWFAIELNDSHLDRYYIFLAVLSSGNFIIYCLVACWYGDDTFLVENGEEEEEEEEEMGAIVHQIAVDQGQQMLQLKIP